jgi:hypothetical protein
MVSPTFDASLHPTNLIIIVPRAEAFRPTDDVYVENPFGAYRGLYFALACNLILGFVGVAGWEIWHLLR